MIDGQSFQFFDTVALAWLLATLLLGWSLWRAAAGEARKARHAAMAGVALIVAAAVYTADVVNLPEIVGACIAGGGVGLLLGRDLRARRLPLLLAALAGIAYALAAAACWLNPYIFGLGQGDWIAPGALVTLALCIAPGLLSLCAFLWSIVSPSWRGIGLTCAGGLAGWSAAALAFILGNPALAFAAGLAGSAGTVLALRLSLAAGRKGLADQPRHP